ncbi:MAG: threonine/serine exporter family protein [Candidatus Metalachnospira sp.]|nr:threonine/serine exporter family protein [Candidatus Metalachnospira sp.]
MKIVLIEMFMAFMACFFFAIIYNTPKKELIFCGIFGCIGYGIYYYLVHFRGFGTSANFFGALMIALLARIVSMNRQIPVMVYILPSVFPLSPGANMYNAAYALIKSDMYTAGVQTMICIKIVGVCVIAILLILSLPDGIFRIVDRKKAAG